MLRILQITFLSLIILSATRSWAENIIAGTEKNSILNNAIIYYLNKDLQAALHTLGRLHNDNDEQTLGTTYLLEGLIYEQTSQNEQAKQSFDLASQINFSLRDAALWKRIEVPDLQAKPEKINQLTKFLTETFPESLFTYQALKVRAESQIELNNFAEAIRTYKTILQQFPNFDGTDFILYKLAITQEKSRHFAQAEDTINTLLYRYPNSTFIEKAQGIKDRLSKMPGLQHPQPTESDIFSAAEMLSEKNKFVESNELLKQLESRFPHTRYKQKAMILSGINKYQYNDFSSAMSIFNKFQSDFPQSSLLAKAYFYKAKILQKTNDPINAKSLYEMILASANSTDFQDKALYNLAIIAKTSGNEAIYYQYLGNIVKHYPQSSLAIDAIWECGWHYYTQGKWEQALEYFQAAQNTELGEQTAKCLFWGAKSAEKKQDIDTANNLYLIIYNHYFYTYYAYLTWARFNADPERRTLLGKKPWQVATPVHDDTILSEGALRLQLLRYLGFQKEYEYEQKKNTTYNPSQKALNSTITSKYNLLKNQLHLSISGVERLISEELSHNHAISIETLQLSYPKAFWDIITNSARTYHLDPFLILALIREESRFNPEARSKSNALGLMQIMPITSLDIANRLKIQQPAENELTQPEVNIPMGSYYLSRLMDRFNNNLLFVLAGYNGGPNNVSKWWNARSSEDMDEFAETIPYEESRYYVQKVLRSYWMYKLIYYDASQEPSSLN